MDVIEINRLRKNVRSEASHFQWARQGICIFLLTTLILMNLLMGSSSRESLIGIKKCEAAYWGIQLGFVAICIVCTVIAVKMARTDQGLKLKYGGVNLTKSDILYSDQKRMT